MVEHAHCFAYNNYIMDMNRSSCPIASAEIRLIDSLNLFVEAKEQYFDPNRFRLVINNLIQALRSITWVLQKAALNIPAFVEWYSKQQETMRADPVMKWLQESRNIIVKQGDLEINSILKISIVESWYDPPKFEMSVPPFTPTGEFTSYFSKHLPAEMRGELGLLRAERCWIESRLSDQEILESLAHVWIFLNKLILNAHNELMEQSIREQCLHYVSIPKSSSKPPPCMVAQDWDRTIWVDLNSGAILTPAIEQVESSKETMKQAAERYSIKELLKHKLGKTPSLKDEASFNFQIAQTILKKDGHHVSMAIIGYPDGKWSIHALEMKDRTEKHMILRQLAADIEKTGADSVILIGEVWLAKFNKETPSLHAADYPERKEALQLIAANKKEIFVHTAVFSRDDSGNILIGKEEISTDIIPNIILPIIDAWKRKK